MFLTNVYDMSNNYNMMVNKNLIECFEVNQIDQSILTDIINNYNIEDNEINSKNNKNNFESKNKTSFKLSSKNR